MGAPSRRKIVEAEEPEVVDELAPIVWPVALFFDVVVRALRVRTPHERGDDRAIVRRDRTASGSQMAENAFGQYALTLRMRQPFLPSGSFTGTTAPFRLPARRRARLSGSDFRGSARFSAPSKQRVAPYSARSRSAA
jgi:hypothetical protein